MRAETTGAGPGSGARAGAGTASGARRTGAVHRLGPVAEIPVGEARAYAVDGQQIAVFRLRGGGLRAVDAVCPHAGGPLADGQSDDAVVICPLHAHVFDLSTGESASGAEPLGCYPVGLAADGTLEVTV
ncbi:Rieske (2Fe-2S) protein [Frankia sp. CNm7]|uniref:Rieske (2Fe-2S) protein n=1 Tax=Frankia nepalensis TaxID=1836974 RepID=A0A937UMA5_9ACTN|nr:Rieske (2Fe-2S) protein [Frankia nepalensis]MBL7508902.1 Rieske (2Fe-2S) protein [Frankia nepalensis]MBL7516741.1 Rieske (2Fe-2S) protein [Frankia nepalensis]MBL7628679.1 Rieske (2Fe-2S) protein [Frankia nepalensis]